jgi:hypothetical protein
MVGGVGGKYHCCGGGVCISLSGFCRRVFLGFTLGFALVRDVGVLRCGASY